jgi:hypothetical protein
MNNGLVSRAIDFRSFHMNRFAQILNSEIPNSVSCLPHIVLSWRCRLRRRKSRKSRVNPLMMPELKKKIVNF